jgi:hypothetical protein
VAKNTKTSTSKLNLKAQSIQIKLLLKPSKTNPKEAQMVKFSVTQHSSLLCIFLSYQENKVL